MRSLCICVQMSKCDLKGEVRNFDVRIHSPIKVYCAETNESN